MSSLPPMKVWQIRQRGIPRFLGRRGDSEFWSRCDERKREFRWRHHAGLIDIGKRDLLRAMGPQGLLTEVVQSRIQEEHLHLRVRKSFFLEAELLQEP